MHLGSSRYYLALGLCIAALVSSPEGVTGRSLSSIQQQGQLTSALPRMSSIYCKARKRSFQEHKWPCCPHTHLHVLSFLTQRNHARTMLEALYCENSCCDDKNYGSIFGRILISHIDLIALKLHIKICPSSLLALGVLNRFLQVRRQA